MCQYIYLVIWSCSFLKWLSIHALGFPYGDQIRKISTFQIEEKCYCLSVELAVWKGHFQMPTISCMWRIELIWRHRDVIWLCIYQSMVLYFLLYSHIWKINLPKIEKNYVFLKDELCLHNEKNQTQEIKMQFWNTCQRLWWS